MAGTLEYGARFLLLRTAEPAADATEIAYRAEIERPGGVHHAWALTFDRATGAATFSDRQDERADGPEPEEWMLAWKRTLAEQVARKARRTGMWPRKTHQWKGPPG